MIGNKVIIIGCSGSGKSYFAKELHRITSLPLFHLDKIYWKKNWEHLTREEMVLEITKIASNDRWIMDGNYSSTLELRINFADTIFFLDMDEDLCIKSERERRGKKRDDFPSFLEEKEDPEFINFIKNFKWECRPMILSLLNKYPKKQIIIFKNREEIANWIKSFY